MTTPRRLAACCDCNEQEVRRSACHIERGYHEVTSCSWLTLVTLATANNNTCDGLLPARPNPADTQAQSSRCPDTLQHRKKRRTVLCEHESRQQHKQPRKTKQPTAHTPSDLTVHDQFWFSGSMMVGSFPQVCALFSPDRASCMSVSPGCSPRCACSHRICRQAGRQKQGTHGCVVRTGMGAEQQQVLAGTRLLRAPGCASR